jgi:hypothetical protein
VEDFIMEYRIIQRNVLTGGVVYVIQNHRLTWFKKKEIWEDCRFWHIVNRFNTLDEAIVFLGSITEGVPPDKVVYP